MVYFFLYMLAMVLLLHGCIRISYHRKQYDWESNALNPCRVAVEQ